MKSVGSCVCPEPGGWGPWQGRVLGARTPAKNFGRQDGRRCCPLTRPPRREALKRVGVRGSQGGSETHSSRGRQAGAGGGHRSHTVLGRFSDSPGAASRRQEREGGQEPAAQEGHLPGGKAQPVCVRGRNLGRLRWALIQQQAKSCASSRGPGEERNRTVDDGVKKNLRLIREGGKEETACRSSKLIQIQLPSRKGETMHSLQCISFPQPPRRLLLTVRSRAVGWVLGREAGEAFSPLLCARNPVFVTEYDLLSNPQSACVFHRAKANTSAPRGPQCRSCVAMKCDFGLKHHPARQ